MHQAFGKAGSPLNVFAGDIWVIADLLDHLRRSRSLHPDTAPDALRARSPGRRPGDQPRVPKRADRPTLLECRRQAFVGGSVGDKRNGVQQAVHRQDTPGPACSPSKSCSQRNLRPQHPRRRTGSHSRPVTSKPRDSRPSRISRWWQISRRTLSPRRPRSAAHCRPVRNNLSPLSTTTTVLPSWPMTPRGRGMPTVRAAVTRAAITAREKARFWRMVRRVRRLRAIA